MYILINFHLTIYKFLKIKIPLLDYGNLSLHCFLTCPYLPHITHLLCIVSLLSLLLIKILSFLFKIPILVSFIIFNQNLF